MTINESVEDYLEAILMLKRDKSMVRSIDVVRLLHYTKPSISRAMSRLRENGYVTMDKEGWLDLTPAGSAIAQRVYERHCLLSEWLISLGVPPETARADACRMEHDMSTETFACLRAHIARSGGTGQT